MLKHIVTVMGMLTILFGQFNIQGKGGYVPTQENRSDCVSPQQRQEMQNTFQEYLQTHPMNPSRDDTTFFEDPQGNGGMFGEDHLITNYVDDNQALYNWIDYTCNFTTYDSHWGTDILIHTLWNMDEMTTPILAAADGIVVYTHDGEFDRNIIWDYSSVANAVALLHDDGTYTGYLHMKKYSVAVAVGDSVSLGDTLGFVGSSGISSWPHLHFEVNNSNYGLIDPWQGDCNTDPSRWVDQHPYLGEYPQDVYNYFSSGVPLLAMTNSFVNQAVSENAPRSKHHNEGDLRWSHVFIRNLAWGDTLRWLQTRNDGGEEFEWWYVPSEDPNVYWPAGWDSFTWSWWWIWGIVDNDTSVSYGTWTERFYINSTVFDSLTNIVVDGELNQLPEIAPVVFDVEAGETFYGEIPSSDADGTLWKHEVTTNPALGMIELYGGYQHRFAYTSISGAAGYMDSVTIAVYDDKNEMNTGKIYFNNMSVGVDDELTPQSFALYPSYPNPFNPITTIRFSVEARHALHLRVYDISGRLIETLVNGEMKPGNHEIQWNASQYASGVYFIELVSGDQRQVQKLLLLK